MNNTSLPTHLPHMGGPGDGGETTIAAIATASGGAIGIIRVSGEQALAILSRIFTKDLTAARPNTVHYGHIVSPLLSTEDHLTLLPSREDYPTPLPSREDYPTPLPLRGGAGVGSLLDEVLVSVFRAPHSYTGEDCAEISCHGSPYILNKVLELLVRQGACLARPGEFTQRAFLNGKMDLSQAEAVADLIASTNRATHHLAMSQLRGGISTKLSRLREQLLELTSLLELELDFSDHEDLEFADRSQLLALARHIDEHITTLAKTFEAGQAIKAGIPVAIVGKTNVGKSTLLNRLLKDERAIVSDIHGTTRDTIEDTINIRGVTFRFIDTAGIRQTTDAIEQIGIDRTYQAIDRARIVLWLIDTPPTQMELQDMQLRCQGKALLLIQNKTDLLAPLHVDGTSLLPISAKTGQGMETLETAIFEAAALPDLTASDVIVTNARHYEALLRAHTHLQRVLDGLYKQISGDLLAEDLRLTIDTLSEITGSQITPNEVLGNIFSHFCVGK